MTPETPREAGRQDEAATKAGRKLHKDIFWERSPNRIRDAVDAAIPLIEQEAAADRAERGLPLDAIETEARQLYGGPGEDHAWQDGVEWTLRRVREIGR